MQTFTQWLEQETDVGTADVQEIQSWLTQRFEDPRERPTVIFRGTEYQVIGEPDMPDARGKFIQATPLSSGIGFHRPTGKPILIPIKPLLQAAS
jgi:hypothetical protein